MRDDDFDVTFEFHERKSFEWTNVLFCPIIKKCSFPFLVVDKYIMVIYVMQFLFEAHIWNNGELKFKIPG